VASNVAKLSGVSAQPWSGDGFSAAMPVMATDASASFQLSSSGS
jgi:hypothetical protein